MKELVDILEPLSRELEDGDFPFTESTEQFRPILTGLVNDYFKKSQNRSHSIGFASYRRFDSYPFRSKHHRGWKLLRSLNSSMPEGLSSLVCLCSGR